MGKKHWNKVGKVIGEEGHGLTIPAVHVIPTEVIASSADVSHPSVAAKKFHNSRKAEHSKKPLHERLYGKEI